MSYTQVKSFNQAQAGTTKNFCLANVTKGYGIPNKYASAWIAWENTQQHGGDAPDGLDVPVYFSYTATIDGIKKNWGHIGVRLANGQFWSDGTVYSSIGAYTANHSPKYVGWGESVNNVTVIKEGAPVSTITTEQVVALSLATTGEQPDPKSDEVVYIGKPLDKSHIDGLITYWAGKSRIPTLEAQLAKANKEVQTLRNQLASEAKVLASGKYLVN